MAELPNLESLVCRYLPQGGSDQLDAALSALLAGATFEEVVYPILAGVDAEIPGVGMHDAEWRAGTPEFPFDPHFERVVRPVTYVPYHLAAPGGIIGRERSIVDCAGAHLEQCVKRLWVRRRRMTLGRAARERRVVRLVGSEVARDIGLLSDLWNVAKHEYSSGGAASVLSAYDAIGGYFVARALGALVLNAHRPGTCDEIRSATNAAREGGERYRRPSLPPATWWMRSGG